MPKLILSSRARAIDAVTAINLGSHFLRGHGRGHHFVPVSKLRLNLRVRGLTSLSQQGSHGLESSKVRTLNQRLGIDPCYGVRHKLALQQEAKLLILCGLDGLKREFWLAPPAALAWQALKQAALIDKIKLIEISGFRSVEYQATLIRRKLRAGQTIAHILQVSAAPGYSEHHSGCAIDIADIAELASRAVLTAAFESTKSYAWLVQNAARFGFTQSFARDNVHDIAYEPWHWCFRK